MSTLEKRVNTVGLSVLLLVSCGVGLAGEVTGSNHISAQNVIANWDTIASTAIVSNAGTPPGSAGVWFAYTSIAVYDAVTAAHGRPFQPFCFRGFAPRDASDQAAAVAAAHRILVHYFPAQQSYLDAQLISSLQALPGDPRTK